MKKSPKIPGVLFAAVIVIVIIIYTSQSGGAGNIAADQPSQAVATLVPPQTCTQCTDTALPSPKTIRTQIPTPKPSSLTADTPPEPSPDPLPAALPTAKAAPAYDVMATVYITESGAKYHSSGCGYLSHSKISIALKEAKEQGYTPCSKCDPPE